MVRQQLQDADVMACPGPHAEAGFQIAAKVGESVSSKDLLIRLVK